MINYITNNPNAKVLINSMRAIGYDFSSAIADLIDNSISAKAKSIDLYFPIAKNTYFLQIYDDGLGMDREELIEAMRFGTVKNVSRHVDDLGRFGLGLKTASISQCRKFTVVSKKNNNICGFYWDLDEISNEEWRLFDLDSNTISKIANVNNYIDKKSFTLVLWEKIDSLDSEINLYNDELKVFLSKIQEAKNHLSLVFHRYIQDGLVIRFNEDKLQPKDPFLSNHKKTLIKPIQSINTKTKDNKNELISFQVYVLPFHKDLSVEDYDLIGGKEKIQEQGFYVYRNKRLMDYGNWFKMQTRNGLFENARIKVDIPNTLDDLWAIDIKKQRAIIPGSVMNQLRKEIFGATETAKQINLYKGSKQIEENSIWNKKVDDRNKSVSYYVNIESIQLKHLISLLGDKEKSNLIEILKLIEISLPYQDIYNSVASKTEINNANEESINVIYTNAIKLLLELKKTINKPTVELINLICSWEPFSNYNLKEKLMKDNR